MPYADAVGMALLALRGGTLRFEAGVWWAQGAHQAQQLPNAIVDRLRAERLVESVEGGPPAFRLSARGERVAAEVAAARHDDVGAWGRTAPLREGPLLTLRPSEASEDVDHLLVLRLDAAAVAAHRARIARARATADADPEGAFDFAQYRSDVWSIPIGDAAVRAGLLPNDPPLRRIETGLDDPDALGARLCPDRGVNYGADAVQVFGGPGLEHPVAVSPAIDAATFEAALAAPADAADGAGSAGRAGRGPLRAIVGFHRDEEGDWVADLACGHGQHVRDDPPWVERAWVRTEAGRRSRLGATLPCARCADGEPPPRVGPEG